jgi:hypothetical protein
MNAAAIEKLEKSIAALIAAIETENRKIKQLRQYYSPLQVRCWIIHRAKLNRRLKIQKQALKCAAK